ncbi:helix-turn-helix domain-containing protein [Acinetobacter baumannii]|uniref:helix-turn-helix domain-containing protein n=1 Tax=Acinetobacter calcoaceticus/baumannii complex TaxID=909768 RepID=UPI00244C6006|nr:MULTISPECIES: helix-turn-helix domain-containing protein [Acinetobacter calcoaceticus/baumannii complex]MDH2544582.1 helix-turn-helix domain-containing protein [Acinetobacter baumannii]MDO7218896.1 helix-turn-helix domain-containing protein [Acinetobacter nosocomialis]MDO7474001.1 helix-turn-helix domain-containing protein [Acinetobacter baumannii]
MENYKSSCQDCTLRIACFPSSVNVSELPQLDAIIEKDQIIPNQDAIFHQYKTSPHIYAVRSGAVKTTISLSDKREQIIGFFLPGDIIGIENIGTNIYNNNAYAIQKTSICAISTENLKTIFSQAHGLQEYFLKLAAKQIQEDQKNMLLLNHLNASERVAMFLLSLAARYKAKQLSNKLIYLPMSKSDISNYLGITAETLSRVLLKLKKEQIIAVKGRLITILDDEYLQNIHNNPVP